MTSNSFRTITTKPTRITDNSSTLNDHIWINDMSHSNTESKIVITDINDHLPIFYDKYSESKAQGYTKINYRPFTETNIAKLNAGIKSQEWNSVKEQAWAQGLEVESKKNLADFTAKFRVTEFNETVTDANAKLKLNADSFRTKENIDPLLQLDRGTQILEDLHKMGALSKPEFLLKVKQYTDKATLDRATLIATNYASGVDAYNMPKTPEDLLVDLQQKLGLSLDSSNIPTVNEAFKTAFMQEINRKNKLNGFREKYINIAFKEENAEINSLLAEKIEAGLVQGNDFEDAKRIAELHGDKVQQRKLRALESNFYNNTQVNPKISDYWTAIGGEGYDHIFNKKNGFKTEGGMIKVKESMEYIR